jgi:hypothetical protein
MINGKPGNQVNLSSGEAATRENDVALFDPVRATRAMFDGDARDV